MKFSHLHNHTQYSLLDGASDLSKLFKKAVEDNQPALAITDHGNMFGVYNFVMEAKKHLNANGQPLVKPIVGCEFYLVEDRRIQQFTREVKDKRYHQLLLAKNSQGYKNLMKLSTLGFTEGLYSKYPRIDKELILKYHEGLICTTCCLGAKVPKTILEQGEEAGEKEFKWWLDVFGDDFYVEFQRHGIPDQIKANKVLEKFAAKYNVPMIASNDNHYVDIEDYNSHDILLCINTGEKQATPIIKEFNDDDVRVKNSRFGFFNNQFYMKSTAEMIELFQDIPEAIDNTNAIVDKIDLVNVTNDLLLPNFELPTGFTDQDDYLSYLTYEGARERYGILTPKHEERIQFELGVIKKMGFAGYFLIVSDIIRWSRQHEVFVGSGRGSAAGSVVAYCIKITNIDPIKYDLLFERFLNPDRSSMPDIDTDFDDAGRGKVISYIVNKYGQNQVAQIITHNSMAAKSSIKDVARVMDLDLQISNQLADLVPTIAGISLREILHYTQEDIIQNGLEGEDGTKITLLQKKYKQDDIEGQVLREAEKLEGTVRNTGIHAAGILIGPKPLDELMPMCRQKDIELNVTQFDGKVVENAGAIKIDILGLSNLTILKESIGFVKANYGIEIDLDTLPLDDPKTFELYQNADTFGTFQFASPGMRNYLKQSKPEKIEDLIALNALYRPGPLKYIPDYISRKLGKQEISYDLASMEEILKETYGITVYQEQVMRLSQKLADFSPGDADLLRKAMGKKQKSVLDKMKEQFLSGCEKNEHPRKIAEKIWTDWEAFAQYAFNKSHSTCYAYLAYQTAYFKANYPAEYMTALLNSKLGNVDGLELIMSECKKMNLLVQGPDINESMLTFSVNKEGIIRFGLSAIKGVGESAVNLILKERETNGAFSDIFDVVSRLNSKAVNKKTIESMAEGGAFDNFSLPRAMYFHSSLGSSYSNLDLILKFGHDFTASKERLTNSLFGEMGLPDIKAPKLAICEEWTLTERLKREKKVLSFYLTAHPLDDFKFELQHYNFSDVATLSQIMQTFEEEAVNGITAGKDTYKLLLGGYLSGNAHITSRKGTLYGKFFLNDYTGSKEMALFKENYLRNKHYLEEMNKVVLEVSVTRSTRKTNTEPYLSIERIGLLSDVKKTYTKRLNLYADLTLINDVFLQIIEKYAERSGNVELGIHIVDSNTNKQISLGNRTIEWTDEFLEEIESIKGLSYRIETA